MKFDFDDSLPDEYNLNTYLGSLVCDIHESLKANHRMALRARASKHKLSIRHIRARARSLGARIADLPVLYSGKASVECLVRKYNYGSRWCVEHEYPRQVAGFDLYYWATNLEKYGDKNIPELVAFLAKCRTVNFTTPEENRRLYQYQLYGRFKDPKTSYQQADIRLVNWSKGTKIDNLPKLYPNIIPLLDRG